MRNRYQPAYRSAYRARAHLRPGARPAYRAAVRIPKGMGYWFPQPNHVQELCKIVRQIVKLPPDPENHTRNVQFCSSFGPASIPDLPKESSQLPTLTSAAVGYLHCHATLRTMKRQRGRVTLTGLCNLIDLASKLGNRSCGLPLKERVSPEVPRPWIDPDRLEQLLKKAYGEKSEGPREPGRPHL